MSQALPLAGVRIVTVEQYGAGPFASMYLADLGAEVIKIENPAAGGDVARKSGPFFIGENDSLFFQTFNRNKKSLTLNLKDDAGKKIFHQLVESADAVMNNLRGDQPSKLGLDYEALKSVNPKIVCAHLSAYGRDNDRANWPGYDYLMQAEAGFMGLTGDPREPPTRFGLSMVDFMTGATTAGALMAALIGVLRGGEGRDVDVSLFDVALQQLTYPATWYLNAGYAVERIGRSAHPSTVPCQLYRTDDSWVFVMCMTPKFWDLMIEGIGMPELGEDPRFATIKDRQSQRETMQAILDKAFSKKRTEEWMDIFGGKIPIAPVYDIGNALDSDYVKQIGMVQNLPHAHDPDFRVVHSPVKLNGERLQGKTCSPLGADTNDVLGGLGYTDKDIAALKDNGAI